MGEIEEVENGYMLEFIFTGATILGFIFIGFLSIIILGGIAVLSLDYDRIEITTGCVTLLGALGMKILEKE